MASNGKFLAVVQPIRLENTGWEIRVRDYNNFSTLVAIVQDWVSFSISPELNGSGQGSITLNLDTLFFTQDLLDGKSTQNLLEYEYLWEAWENGSLRFQWLGRNVDEQRISEDETRTVTISGPGTADLLKSAVILRPGFPKALPKKALNNPNYHSGTDNSPAYKWIFPTNWTVMRMWYTLFKSAQKRGTIPWIKPTFTAFKDSGGAKWKFVPTVATFAGEGFSPQIGQTLYDFLQDCTGQDFSKYWAEYCEWVMHPGFKLDVRPSIGAHREKKVIFFEGGSIYDKQRTRSRENIGNFVIVNDNTGRDSHVSDAASIKHWNRREYFYDQAEGTTTIAARRTAVARNVLRQQRNEVSEWTITVPAFEEFKRPFYDYQPGDWIGISTWHASSGNTVAAYRVLAITVTVDGETPTVELTLQDEFHYELNNLQKQLTWIIHQVTKKPQAINTNDNQTDTTNTTNATFGKEGYADGIRVFIQPGDPGKLARAGDFWYDTSYTLGNSYVYTVPPATSSVVLIGSNDDSTADYTPADSGNLNPFVQNGGIPPGYYGDDGNLNPRVNPQTP